MCSFQLHTWTHEPGTASLPDKRVHEGRSSALCLSRYDADCCFADSAMPTLACKGAVTVNLGDSVSLTDGAFDNDDTSSVSVSCEQDTEDLGVGVGHEVKCTATDGSGNVAECTVLVTVQGALARCAWAQCLCSAASGADWCRRFAAAPAPFLSDPTFRLVACSRLLLRWRTHAPSLASHFCHQSGLTRSLSYGKACDVVRHQRGGACARPLRSA